MVETLIYFIRKPGAIITEETFNTVVQFAELHGDPVKTLLNNMTCLHAPAVVLTPFRNKNKEDNYLNHMYDFLSFLTGECLRGKQRKCGPPDNNKLTK